MLPCTTYSCQVTSLHGRPGTAADEGERTRLTRDFVVTRALALADELGLDGLTIRKLATELGVTPMALYWHFRSKDELLDGLADRVWSEINVELDRCAPWPDQFRRLYESLLTVLRSHPAAAGLLLRSKQMEIAAACSAMEASLEILRTAGFGVEDASAITRSAL